MRDLTEKEKEFIYDAIFTKFAILEDNREEYDDSDIEEFQDLVDSIASKLELY